MNRYLNNDFDLDSDELVEVFDELNLWAAPFGLKLLGSIEYRRNITVLDIGFGAGFPLTEIAMRLGNTCRVIGIDPWEAAIRRAKKKISFYGIENTTIIKGYAEEVPLEDASVDLIVSNNGMNNVTGIEMAYAECARVLKRGGQFIQTMNLDDSMIEFYDIMERLLRQKGLEDNIQKMKQHIYEKRKPIEEIMALGARHGLQTDLVLHDKFEYKFADGTAMLNHFNIRLGFMEAWKRFLPEQQMEDIFVEAEQLMNRQAELSGCFKLGIPFALVKMVKD